MIDRLYPIIEKIEEKDRLKHTVSVAYECERIAELFNLTPESKEELLTAAMFHDITKGMSISEHIALAEEFSQSLSEEDLDSPAILHQITGALYLKKHFHEYYSKNAASAISKHTTGDECMSLIDKILCLADYIEKGRPYPSCIETREYFYSLVNECPCEAALDLALLKYFNNTIDHIKRKNLHVHSKTVAAYEALKKLQKGNQHV